MLSAAPAAIALAGAGAEAATAGDIDSAALIAQDSAALAVQGAATALETTYAPRADDSQAVRFESRQETTRVRQELVVIDAAAEDYQQLVDDLLAREGETRRFEVVVLDSDRGGVEQIGELLRRYESLDALHVVSHGAEGAIKLGDSWLSLDNVGAYAGQLAGWRDAFAADADMLFYGCDVAASEDGRALLDSLHALCNCDVAASDDNTGSQYLGGDWDLEYTLGKIETSGAFSQQLQQNWGHLLNVGVDATSVGTTNSASATISHTTAAGPNRLMLVGVTIRPNSSETVSTVTYNGVGLSFVGARNGPTGARVEIWSLVAPATGTHDVVVSLSSASHGGATVGVMTFTDVDQATPLRSFTAASGDDDSGAAVVSSATGELVFAAIAVKDSDQNLVPGAGQTERWDLFTGAEANGGGSTEAGAASVNMSWTWSASTDWAIGAVAIRSSAANAAPALANTSVSLAPILEDAAAPAGAVGTLVSNLVDLTTPAGGQDNVTDSDSGDPTGLAIVAADTANGSWHFSTDNGLNWFALGPVSGGSARVLAADAATRVYFQPNPNFAGNLAAAITFRAWDQSDGSANGAAGIDTAVNGGATAFSVASDVANLTVVPINDAPTLDNTGDMTLMDVGEDDADPPGDLVSDIINSAGGDRITDADGGALEGLAVIGVDNSNGVWQYDAGGGWTAFGAVSDSSAVVLDTLARIRFVPSANYSGPAGDIAFRAWDRSDGHSSGDVGVNVSSNGATTAYSTATETATLNVIPVNDPSILAAVEGAALPYTENDPPTVVTSAITVNDSDSVNLAGATVRITGNYAIGQDTLGFTNTPGISGSWDAASGTLTLLGADTVANYEAALRAVTYENSSEAPATLIRTVSFTVDDGSGPSNTVTRDITVAAVNDAPFANDDPGYMVAEDGGLAVGAGAGVLQNDTDVEGDSLNAVLVSGPANSAAFSLNPDGAFSYTPNADFNGVDTFTYRANDGALDSALATATITVTAVNDAPILADTAVSLNSIAEDSPAPAGAVGDLISKLVDPTVPAGGQDNVVDPDAGALTGVAVIGADAANGIWWHTIDGGAVWSPLGSVSDSSARVLANDGNTRLYFQPNADFAGGIPAAITFRAWDQTDGSLNGAAGVDTSVNGAATAFSAATDVAALTVVPTNDAPLLDNTGVMSLNDVAEDDADPPGNLVSDIVNSAGGDRITDVDAGAVEGLAVVGVDDTNGVWQYDAGGGWTPFGAVSDSSAVMLDTLAVIRFVPNPNYSGSGGDIAFRAWDQTDGRSSGDVGVDVSVNGAATAYSVSVETATLSVLPANDPATLANIEAAPLPYTENDPPIAVTTAVTVNDVDDASLAGATIQITGNYALGQDVLAFSDTPGISGAWDAASGTLTLLGVDTVANYQAALRAVTYENTSDAPSTLARTVSFVVNDGSGPSNTATRDIAVAAVNDAPTAADDPGHVVDEDVTLNVSAGAGVLANDFDPEGDTLTASLVSGPSNAASFSLNPDGGFSYTPAADFNGVDTFTYRANDGALDSAVATATITINTVNDAPVVANVEVAPLSYAENDPPIAVTAALTVNDADDASLVGATVQITGNYALGQDVLAFSDTPGISGAWDAASGTLTLLGVDTVANYQAALRAATYENTSDAPSALTRTVSFVVNDGSGSSNTATRDIAVAAVNDAPISADDPGHVVDEDVTLNVNAGAGVLANDFDLEGDTLTASLVSGPSNAASFSLDPDGSFSYTPAADFNGVDTFTYRAHDGALDSAVATATITINARNDAPTNAGGLPSDVAVTEDAASVVDLSLIDLSDADALAGNLTVRLSTASGGSLYAISGGGVAVVGSGGPVVTLTGTLSDLNAFLDDPLKLQYLAPADLNGDNADALIVEVNDNGNTGPGGGGDALLGVVNIDIGAVNDAPWITAPAGQSTAEDSPLVFSTANGNALTVSDLDAGGAAVQVTLSVLHGSLNLAGTTGLTFLAGANGAASMTFTASLLDITAALDGLTYQGDLNLHGADTLSVAVDDLGNTGAGGSLSDTATIGVTVTPVNDAPTPGPAESYSALGSKSLRVEAPGLLANDSDIEGDPLSVALVGGPSSGTLVLNADGSFVFTAPVNFEGAATFSYVVTDGAASSAAVTVTIDVELAGPPPGNSPPANDSSTDDSTKTDGDSEAPEEALAAAPPPVQPTEPAPSTRDSSDGAGERRTTPTVAPILLAANGAADDVGEEEFVYFEAGSEHRPLRGKLAAPQSRASSPSLQAFVNPQMFWDRLDDFQQGLHEQGHTVQLVVGSVAIASLAVTAGYVVWMAKGGYLLASVLSQMPAWKFIDPLPIYDAMAGDWTSAEDDELDHAAGPVLQ